MKIKDKNYDEKRIKDMIKLSLDRITYDVFTYNNIYPSTVKTAENLFKDLKFYLEEVLEEE